MMSFENHPDGTRDLIADKDKEIAELKDTVLAMQIAASNQDKEIERLTAQQQKDALDGQATMEEAYAEIERLKAELSEKGEYGYSQEVVDALTKERDQQAREIERLKEAVTATLNKDLSTKALVLRIEELKDKNQKQAAEIERLKDQENQNVNIGIDMMLDEELRKEIGVEQNEHTRNVHLMVCRLCSFINDQQDEIERLKARANDYR